MNFTAKAPTPSNVTELISFVGLNKLLQRILPIFLSPLQVTKEGYPLLLVGRSRKAILTSKAMLQSSSMLDHFDPSKDIIRL